MNEMELLEIIGEACIEYIPYTPSKKPLSKTTKLAFVLSAPVIILAGYKIVHTFIKR